MLDPTRYEEVAIRVAGDVSTTDVAVVLQFVGHPLTAVSAAIRAPHHVMCITSVKHTGHIPPDAEWMRIGAEIGSVVLSEVSKGKTVHLFAGLPTTLAFMVGHVLGDHNRILVYHYEKADDYYTEAFALNQLMHS